MVLKDLNIDDTWTLFLDRDGVINLRMKDDYIRSWDQFRFLPGVREAIAKLSPVFGKIIVVTNQQGIGKKLYTEADLAWIHAEMETEIQQAGGRIDGIFYCPHLVGDPLCNCRKPRPGLALQAKEKFPSIDFSRSLMVGDSNSDMQFAKGLGMRTIWMGEEPYNDADFQFPSLPALADAFS